MDYRKIFVPIYGLYIPSGWCVEKNHVFNLNANGFSKIKNKNLLFLAKEYFISECIFYAKSEIIISTTKSLLGVVDIGCKLINEERFLLEYDINLWINYKDNIIYDFEYKKKNPKDALYLASNLMKKLSHGELEINDDDLKIR